MKIASNFFTIIVKIFCSSTFSANFESHCNSRHISNLASSLGARVLLLLMVMERDTDPQSQPLLHKCPNVPYGILILTSLTESKFSKSGQSLRKEDKRKTVLP